MRTLMSLLVALSLAIAGGASLHAEDPATPLKDALEAHGVGMDLDSLGIAVAGAATPESVIASFDAAGNPDDFDWPEYVTAEADEEAGTEEETAALNDLIIGAVDGASVETSFITNNLWIMIAAMLVFIMHLGFATLESGLTQAKNTTNILFKNTMIVCIGLITYAIIGFNLMYPVGNWIIPNFLGAFVPGISPGDMSNPVTWIANNTSDYAGYTWWTDFLFQGMFAATAATIVSGCVAERIKLLPFLVFSTIYVGFLYPFVGSWHWGGGWLGDWGFYDFAGSTLVHSVGGWGGLAAILILGPRKGKYVDGEVRPVMPSNLPLAAIGVFLLWFGWFGFNGGSWLDANPAGVSYVLVTTSLAAAFGGLTAGVVSWVVGGKPDLTMALNGILAGLVGITAGPDIASLWMTVFIGISSGVIVYFAVIFFDKLKIDDPVGALSVHLACGIWGTLAVAFTTGNFAGQIVAIIAYAVVSFVFALVLCLIIKAVLGFRVSEEEETEGLDAGEHGMGAYHNLTQY